MNACDSTPGRWSYGVSLLVTRWLVVPHVATDLRSIKNGPVPAIQPCLKLYDEFRA